MEQSFIVDSKYQWTAELVLFQNYLILSDAICAIVSVELRSLLYRSNINGFKYYRIHHHVCEIFGCNLDEPFARKMVLIVGDLLQLPPVKAGYVSVPPPGRFGSVFSLWSTFKMCEVTGVMCQRGDNTFIELLNNVGVADLPSFLSVNIPIRIINNSTC